MTDLAKLKLAEARAAEDAARAYRERLERELGEEALLAAAEEPSKGRPGRRRGPVAVRPPDRPVSDRTAAAGKAALERTPGLEVIR